MEITMPYRTYKNEYPDCRSKSNSYNKQDKTIVVIVSDGYVTVSEAKKYIFDLIESHDDCSDEEKAEAVEFTNNMTPEQIKEYYNELIEEI